MVGHPTGVMRLVHGGVVESERKCMQGRMGREAAMAVIAEESRPPESRTPTGTSLRIAQPDTVDQQRLQLFDIRTVVLRARMFGQLPVAPGR